MAPAPKSHVAHLLNSFVDSLCLEVGSTLGDRHARNAHAQKRAPQRRDPDPTSPLKALRSEERSAKAQGSEVGSRTNLLQGDHWSPSSESGGFRHRPACFGVLTEGPDWAGQASDRATT